MSASGVTDDFRQLFGERCAKRGHYHFPRVIYLSVVWLVCYLGLDIGFMF